VQVGIKRKRNNQEPLDRK